MKKICLVFIALLFNFTGCSTTDVLNLNVEKDVDRISKQENNTKVQQE